MKQYIYVVTINIVYETEDGLSLLATLSHAFTKESHANDWELYQWERDDEDELLKEALGEFYQCTDKFDYIQDSTVFKVELN